MQAVLDAVLFDLDSTLLADPLSGSGADDRTPRLRDGVDAELERLRRDVRVAAVSDAAIVDDEQLRAALESSGLPGLVDAVVSANGGAGTKAGGKRRAAAMLERAGGLLGATDAGRVAFVGRTDAHEAAASAAGMVFVRVGESGDEDGDGLAAALEGWIERCAGEHFEQARARVDKSDIESATAATAQQARLAKPLGSLGRLEPLGTQLSAIAGTCPPPVPEPAALVIFAADHGIAEWEVSPRPRDETARLLATTAAGTGAASVLAHQLGARVLLVDVGVAVEQDEPGVAGGRPGDPDLTEPGAAVFHRSIRQGSGNLAAGPAMTRAEALLALDVGAEMAHQAVAAGARCLVLGDLGVGSSTPAACLVAAITNHTPAEVTGRGSGADDEMLARKIAVVNAAVENLSSTVGPLTLLEQVGGLEIAALAGCVVGAAAERVPVLVGGLAGYAAVLLAVQLAPDAIDYVVAAQRQADPGVDAALEFLGLSPLLDLDLRLGQGFGALLALPIVQAAARILAEMANVAEMA